MVGLKLQILIWDKKKKKIIIVKDGSRPERKIARRFERKRV